MLSSHLFWLEADKTLGSHKMEGVLVSESPRGTELPTDQTLLLQTIT